MPRRLLLICVLHLCALPIVAQPARFSFNHGTIEAAQGYYQELPYEMIGGYAYVSVIVGGKSRRFLVDTGATTVITPQLQGELNLPPALDRVAYHDANMSVQLKTAVILPGVQLGDLTVSTLR